MNIGAVTQPNEHVGLVEVLDAPGSGDGTGFAPVTHVAVLFRGTGADDGYRRRGTRAPTRTQMHTIPHGEWVLVTGSNDRFVGMDWPRNADWVAKIRASLPAGQDYTMRIHNNGPQIDNLWSNSTQMPPTSDRDRPYAVLSAAWEAWTNHPNTLGSYLNHRVELLRIAQAQLAAIDATIEELNDIRKPLLAHIHQSAEELI